MTIAATVVGRTLAGLGVRQVFGVVGSGNFHVTNALVDSGARWFVTDADQADPAFDRIAVRGCPLGDAALEVLLSEETIEAAAIKLVSR